MSEKNKQRKDQKINRSAREKELENPGSENASASRGGITELDEESLTVRRGQGSERGSGITTKRTVTGSDLDGQVG
jgi:hypothetical protein